LGVVNPNSLVCPPPRYPAREVVRRDRLAFEHELRAGLEIDAPHCQKFSRETAFCCLFQVMAGTLFVRPSLLDNMPSMLRGNDRIVLPPGCAPSLARIRSLFGLFGARLALSGRAGSLRLRLGFFRSAHILCHRRGLAHRFYSSYAGFWVIRPDQAARFSATLVATPSVNVTPSMSKGNWFAPFRRRHVLAAA